MSDELLEAETAPVPVTTKSSRPSFATILGLALLVIAIGLGLYVGSFWQQHNSRLARLKAKNGDYVQFEHRGDIDEFAPPQQRQGRRGRGGDGEEGGEGNEGENQDGGGDNLAKREVKEPAWYDKYVEEMFPKPVHVVYWRDPSLTADDIKMILEFQDLEILSINCDSVDSDAIGKFLALPKLRRLNIQAKKLGVEGIDSWKPESKFRTLSLINPSWTGEEIEAVYKKAEGNAALKDKINATSSARPSFGGA